jgi:hypothetical protein
MPDWQYCNKETKIVVVADVVECRETKVVDLEKLKLRVVSPVSLGRIKLRQPPFRWLAGFQFCAAP